MPYIGNQGLEGLLVLDKNTLMIMMLLRFNLPACSRRGNDLNIMENLSRGRPYRDTLIYFHNKWK